MSGSQARADLHTQLATVIRTLEQELADLESARDKLARAIEAVLYRNTPRGERRRGQRRNSPDRRQEESRKDTPGRRARGQDRRLPQDARISQLQAQITALSETIDVLKRRQAYLIAQDTDGSTS